MATGPAASAGTGVSLRAALDDPALIAAGPVVRAGQSGLDRQLRWVHTSEVLDIADLLSGGELILVAGVLLAVADENAMRAYIDALADVGAVGLAIEGPRVGAVPPVLAEQAELRNLPLIELTEVVRFVDVTRAINSRLVAESVRELQFNDEVSQAMGAALAARGDIHAMVAALRDLTGCAVTVRSVTGAVIAAQEVEGARPRGYARVVPIDSADVTVATLELRPRAGVDLQMVEAACRRAPESLALALMRWQPMTRSDQQVREVFRLMASAGEGGRTRVERMENARAMAIAAGDLGFDAPGLYVGVVAIAAAGQLQTAELSGVLRSAGYPVLSEVRDGLHRSILRFPIRPGRGSAADEVVHRLCSSALPSSLRIGVTAPADDLVQLSSSMSTAHRAARAATERDYVVRARDVTLQHFLDSAGPSSVDNFLDAVIGPLLDSPNGSELVLTLATLHRTGSRVAAAKALNIHRQTMYQRLDRISVILGGLPENDSGAMSALLVAAQIAVAQRAIQH